jgi:cytochrome P450
MTATPAIDDDLNETGFDGRLAALMASDPTAMADPYPLYAELREAGAAHRHGPMVLVTRFDAAKRIFLESNRYSNHTTRGSRAEEALSRMTGEERDAFHRVSDFEAMYVSRSDGAQHDRLRRIGHRAFTPRRIAALRERLQRYTDSLLGEARDSASGGVADLMPFAYRLPLMAIADMLEVPQADRETIHGWSATIGENRRGVDPRTLLPALRAIEEFGAYIREMVADRRTSPRESDLVRLLLDAGEEDVLTEEELTAMFVVLLFAGHETTTNLLGTGTRDLLANREQWHWLCTNPAQAEEAVEELLRFVSPTQWAWRVALEDVTIDGVAIAPGTTIGVMIAAANRDPRAFDRPDELDLTRPEARKQLGFGLGVHFCLGNALARLEGEIAFGTLARRFPEAQLVDEPLTWRGNAMFRSLVTLPVVLGPDHAPTQP